MQNITNTLSAAPVCGEFLPRLHLCIASEQTLANVLPLKRLPWEQVIVIASDQFRLGSQARQARLQQLLRWAESEAHQRGLSPVHAVRVLELPDTGLGWSGLLAFARRLAAELTLKHPGQSIDLNVTGGTKLMSQAFSTAFAGQARMVYCNTQGAALEVLDPEGRAPTLALAPDLLNLKDYLFAQGFEVSGFQSAADAPWLAMIEQRLPLTLALVREAQRLRQTQGYRGKRLLTMLHGMAAESLSASFAQRPFQPECECMAPHTPVWTIMIGLLQTHGIAEVMAWETAEGQLPGLLRLRWTSEDAARYLAGGYLEEYAFLCAHALGLPPGQIGMNVRLRLADSRLPESYDYQELDVVLAWGNRLWVLECKAGVQVHNGAGQDVLNKLDTLKARVGGALGEGWLLTPLPLREDFEQQLPVIERARNYSIRLVNGGRELSQLPGALAVALQRPDVAPTLGSAPADLRHALDEAAAAYHQQMR